MKPLFSNSTEIEKHIKERYDFPPFVMMENAATVLSDKIIKAFDCGDYDDVIIVCGKGNNGADGLAAARKLFWKLPVKVCFLGEVPESNSQSNQNAENCIAQSSGKSMVSEAASQFIMASKIGVSFVTVENLKSLLKNKSQKYIIVDCIYGTGFHGELSASDTEIIDVMNKLPGYKIACDIPSALKFKADLTVTMGTLKTILYSDDAKDVVGEIKLAELGLSENAFEKSALKYVKNLDAYLLEESDIKLPFREEKKSHKGKFGHAVIVAGEKSGAGVMAAEASLSFGAGLVSLLKTPSSTLRQFKITPELMIADDYPKKATAVLIGSGLGKIGRAETKSTSDKSDGDSVKSSSRVSDVVGDFISWFKSTSNPSCVLDADFFAIDSLAEILAELNKVPNARIVLTPHAKELCDIYKKCLIAKKMYDFTPESILNHRIEIGKRFTKKYPNITLVMKGSNTFIASDGEVFVFDGGAQSLSKGGSGDVLAGMITSLLAQGYSSRDAAITAVYHHGTIAKKYGERAFNLIPKKLISLI